MKTKNYELHFSFDFNQYDWALPLRINIEWFSKDYAEIELHILCFWFSFTRIAHKFWDSLRSDNIGENHD